MNYAMVTFDEIVAKVSGDCDTLDELLIAYGNEDEAFKEWRNQIYMHYTRELVSEALTKIRTRLTYVGLDEKEAQSYVTGCAEMYLDAYRD